MAFKSRKMSQRDQFLSAYESELLAIVYALTKWKTFIRNKSVTVQTDHATLSRNVNTEKGHAEARVVTSGMRLSAVARCEWGVA